MGKPAVSMFAQFMRELIHSMADLVSEITVDDVWSFLLGWCRLVYLLFIVCN